MEYITIDNKNCIFLNHQKLLQDLYQRHVAGNSPLYTLKQEIFNFKPKADAVASEGNSNLKKLKYRNRKRKAETENEALIKEKLYIQPFIQTIKQKYIILPEITDDFPRVWEEQYEFPQFRGANPTMEFQITKLANKDYIIPPNTKFFNHNVENLSKLLPELETYDLIIMDMPWQNKYIKRLNKVNDSLAYRMLDNEILKNMPIPTLMHTNSLIALWCTNALQHRKALEDEFLPNWNLQLVHCLKWFKTNSLGELITPPKPAGYKQPYELLYIACPKSRNLLHVKDLLKVDFLISVPSIIHSHKPPIAEWLAPFAKTERNFKGLEIFARYLQPAFTSIGIEVLKLMDKRLYNVIEDRMIS